MGRDYDKERILNMLAPNATLVKRPWYYDGRKHEHTFTAHKECSVCKGKGYIFYSVPYLSGIQEKQCIECLKLNEAWKRTYPVFYRISRVTWRTWVYAYAEINGEHERLIMEYIKSTWKQYEYRKVFKSLEAAQAWIAAQHQGDISRFWLGL